VTALDAHSSAIGSAAERLHSAGTATRVLYLASSALTGAVLYLLMSWPNPHGQARVDGIRPVTALPAQPNAQVER
jgi:hypothetical protein